MNTDRWGLLVLDKPPGITSHTAVQKVRRALRASKAGHAGTLDPLATGVLLVALGRATRLMEYLVGQDKAYRARVRLGEVRDSLDRDGQLIETRPIPRLDQAAVEEALGRFLGPIEQIPPAFSSIKRGGVRLYRRARRGEIVEAPPRAVQIHRIHLVAFEPPDLVIDLTCSKGTYVRALARDLGEALDTGGTLWELVRTASGPFGIEDALSLVEVEAGGESIWSRVLPPSRMVENLSAVVVDEDGVRTLASGRELRCTGIEASGPVAVFDDSGELVAVADSDREQLRPEKVFSNRP